MTEEQFRAAALSMPLAVEGAHMGHADFRVGPKGKIFASLPGKRVRAADGGVIEGDAAMVVLTPEQQREFVRESPAAFTPAAGAWGKRGCTYVVLTEAGVRAAKRAVRMAWENVGGREVEELGRG